MSYQNSIYNNPEKFGLVTVGEADKADSYEFDIIALWHDGVDFLWAEDSGCSCPSPFENFTDLDALTRGSKFAACEAVLQWGKDDYRDGKDQATRLIETILNFTPPAHTKAGDWKRVETLFKEYGDGVDDDEVLARIKSRLTD